MHRIHVSAFALFFVASLGTTLHAETPEDLIKRGKLRFQLFDQHGLSVGSFSSEGLDHQVKQNMALGVSGKVAVDDVRVWSLN